MGSAKHFTGIHRLVLATTVENFTVLSGQKQKTLLWSIVVPLNTNQQFQHMFQQKQDQLKERQSSSHKWTTFTIFCLNAMKHISALTTTQQPSTKTTTMFSTFLPAFHPQSKLPPFCELNWFPPTASTFTDDIFVDSFVARFKIFSEDWQSQNSPQMLLTTSTTTRHHWTRNP